LPGPGVGLHTVIIAAMLLRAGRSGASLVGVGASSLGVLARMRMLSSREAHTRPAAECKKGRFHEGEGESRGLRLCLPHWYTR
jgi:hypothetical protein